IGAMVLAYLAAKLRTPFTTAGTAVMAVAIGLGAVGAFDDLLKIRKQRSLGLNKTAKIVGQAVVAVLFTLLVVKRSHVTPDLSFIRDTTLNLGLAFYAWVFVMIAAASNGVNLTDGLDGLASGSSALVFAAYVIIAFWEARHSCLLPNASAHSCYPIPPSAALDVAIVAAGALGSVAGFPWWNAAPAKIFMGDTGS